jgi:hypothetical protein
MSWSPGGSLRLVSNRVSETSPLHAGDPIMFVNSAAVSRKTGEVFFTSSVDIPPAYNYEGEYSTFKTAVLTGLTVRYVWKGEGYVRVTSYACPCMLCKLINSEAQLKLHIWTAAT